MCREKGTNIHMNGACEGPKAKGGGKRKYIKKMMDSRVEKDCICEALQSRQT